MPSENAHPVLRAEKDTSNVAPAPQSGSASQQLLARLEWMPSGDLQLAQWLECGRRLGAIGRGVAWWIGDWLLFGNAKYGEKYTRAARVTGYDPQSLMNMCYVASRRPGGAELGAVHSVPTAAEAVGIRTIVRSSARNATTS